MMKWLPLIVALLLNAAANVLLKVGSKTASTLADDASFWTRAVNFLNVATLVGLALFAANVLVYRRALDRLPLSVAYPIMVSGAVVLATLAAVALPVLREKVAWWQVAGMTLIIAGVWLVSRPPKPRAMSPAGPTPLAQADCGESK